MNSVQRYFKLDDVLFKGIIKDVFEYNDVLYYTQRTDKQLNVDCVSKYATLYITKKEYLKFLKIDYYILNNENLGYIDEEVSYVLVFNYKKSNLLESRIKYNRFYFDEEYNKVMKSDEFIKWADSVVKEIVKYIAKYNKNNTL